MHQPSSTIVRKRLSLLIFAGFFSSLTAMQSDDTLWADLDQSSSPPAAVVESTKDEVSTSPTGEDRIDSTALHAPSAAESTTAEVEPFPQPATESEIAESPTADTAQLSSTTTPPLLDSNLIAQRERAAAKRQELLGPVKVSQVTSVASLESFRSPKKALFLSLLVPGLGQFYIGNSTGTRVRGALYLTAEAALFFSWWKWGVNAYNEKIDEARSWSKAHYDNTTNETRLRALYKEAVNADADQEFKSINLSHREQWCQALYSSNDERARSVCSALGNQDFDNHLANLEAPDFSPYDRNSYELLLETGDLVLGWEDTETMSVTYSTALSSLVSPQQEKYRSLRSDANRAAELQTLFIGGIIFNHILSAVDAALTAHFHNQKLYERNASAATQIRFYGGSFVNGGELENRISMAVLF